MAGLNVRRRLAVPMNVPLVPRPATKCVSAPPVCSMISGAVVVVLVRVEVAIGFLSLEPSRLADRAVGAFERVGQEQLGAERFQDELALRARIRGHAQLDLVSARRANHRVRDTRIAGCRVENREAGFQGARFLAFRDHARRRAVLDRTAGVLAFDLRADFNTGALFLESPKPDERGAAYEIEDGNADGRDSWRRHGYTTEPVRIISTAGTVSKRRHTI